MAWIATDKMLSLEPINYPKMIGWYPGLRCWDVQEGFFPCAAYWNGKEWNPENTTHWLDQVMPNKNQAENEAYKNDPNW